MSHQRIASKTRILLLVGICATFCLPWEAWAAKQDKLKGLFGNYRREEYVENDGNSSDFGMNIMLSTLLPVSSFVKSEEVTRGNPGEDLKYSTFFNLEISAFLTLGYNWELYASLGYYSYETRKENATSTPAKPQFHQFELQAYPLIGGVKYRFSRSDLVPYLGAGFGIANVKRRGFYDYNPVQFDQEIKNYLAGEVVGGFEFFFGPGSGIRLEVAAFYMNLEQRTFDTQATPGNLPILIYQAKPWSVRYASGVFFMF